MKTDNDIKSKAARWIGMMAIVSSTCLLACEQSTNQGTGTDANTENMGAGNDTDPADTLTVGGASDGTPPGSGAMQDTVHTPGVNMDSIQNSQTGSDIINSGSNSGEVNSPANRNSALSDSVNAGNKNSTGEQMDSPGNKNINPNNKEASGNNGN